MQSSSPSVTVDVPAEFAKELSAATVVDLSDLRESTYALVSRGKEHAEIVKTLAEAGWSSGFADWYVGVVGERRSEVSLVVPMPVASVPPQVQVSGQPRDLEADMIEPVCSKCGARYSGKMTRSPLGFPLFKCTNCSSRELLPLKGYRYLYLFIVVLFGFAFVGALTQGAVFIPGGLVVIGVWGLIADFQVIAERRKAFLRLDQGLSQNA